MLPSCVPAADLEESGAVLRAGDLRAYYENPRVLGLAEMMNAPGTVRQRKAFWLSLRTVRTGENGLTAMLPDFQDIS